MRLFNNMCGRILQDVKIHLTVNNAVIVIWFIVFHCCVAVQKPHIRLIHPFNVIFHPFLLNELPKWQIE